MEQFCLSVYGQLQHELKRINNENACIQKQIELRFASVYRYWSLVREKLCLYDFESDEAEIVFFKFLKPKFTSQLEYTSLLYHSVLFEPDNYLLAIQFWEREHARLEIFQKNNNGFVYCYNNRKCKMNPYYFLRRYYLQHSSFETCLYNTDSNLATNGDHLAATFLALKKINRYSQKRLLQLKNN